MRQEETKNFKTDKMVPCPCGCGLTIIDSEFWTRLDKARDIAGVPFTITSGARCLEYNYKIGSTPTSSHIKGLAVDIATVTSGARFKVIKGLMEAGFTRVGYNGPKKFVHVDLDYEKPQELMFDY